MNTSESTTSELVFLREESPFHQARLAAASFLARYSARTL